MRIASALLATSLLLAPAAVARPNIVVIVADDQDDQGSFQQAMPTVSQLAETGLSFTNAFVAQPECGPNRASFLTGQYPHNHGARHNRIAHDRFAPREADSLGPWLQTSGYTTGLFGKYLNGYQEVPSHVPPGWDEWQAMVAPRYLDFDMNENGTVVHYDTEYSTDLLAGRVTDFIERTNGPFFIYLTPFAPHVAGPGDPPLPAARHHGSYQYLPLPERENFNEADVSDKPDWVQALTRLRGGDVKEVTRHFRRRRESLRAIDDMVDQVIQALKAKGVYQNTIIIYTSDNGFSEGSHRYVSKGVAYEESVQVPLIIRGLGIRHGQLRGHLVNTTDLTAFILEKAGAVATTTIDGRSFAPIIADGHSPWRKALLLEGTFPHWIAARSRTQILVRHATAEREVYDMIQDRPQLDNRADDDPDPDITQLTEWLRQLPTCAGDDCWIE